MSAPVIAHEAAGSVGSVLFVTTVVRTVEAFLLPLADRLSAEGYDVDVLAAGAGSSEPCARHFRRALDISWTREPWRIAEVTRAARRVRQVVRDGGYRVVHVHTPVAAFVTRMALASMRRSLGVSVIYTAHGFHFYQGQPWLRHSGFLALEKLAGRHTDWLVTMNDEDRTAAVKETIVSSDRVIDIWGVGVDPDAWEATAMRHDACQAAAEAGVPSGASYLVCVAESIPRKRPLSVIEAFARSGASSSHLVFAGDGPLLEACRSAAERLGVAERVHLPGQVGRVGPLVSGAEALVLFSAHEGLPRSILEAMSMEVPVIGSDIRGIRDLLSSGAGILVPSGDVDALADAMRRILSDKSAARRMGAAGRRAVLETYSLEHVLDDYVELYRRAVGG